MRSESRSVAILGAGALGLVTALRLAQRGHDVTVYEREPLAGGLASGFEIEPGMWLEKFYHHLFRSDHQAIGLVGELGLGDKLRWSAPPTVTLRDGRLHRLDSPTSLLRFTPLPMVDRLRMGAGLAYLRMTSSAQRLEGHTAGRWITQTMGRKAHEVVWGPLLRGKFGVTADEIAMPWFWARVHDRTTQLGYLAGGFQQLYEALAARIVELGGTVHLGTTVERIEPAATGLDVTVRDGEDVHAAAFSEVVSTLPTRLTIRLTPSLPDSYRALHDWGRAYGAHCLILALDRPLTDAYWVNVNDAGFPFMALVEHTNYQPVTEYGGRHLVYLGNYRPMDDPLLTLSTGCSGGELRAPPGAAEPSLRRTLDIRRVELCGTLRPAHRHHGLPRAHSAVPHARPRTVGREHVPGLPSRPRAELLGRARRAAGLRVRRWDLSPVLVAPARRRCARCRPNHQEGHVVEEEPRQRRGQRSSGR